MSPILVRPVREQLEHDRVIRLLQAKYKRKFEVAINPGNEQHAGIGTAPSLWYPDLVLYSTERSRKLVGTIEVETAESVNNLEAMSQWLTFGRQRAFFHLYVPGTNIDTARRLCTDLQVPVAELWAYHPVGEQIRFTLVYRDPAAEAKSKSTAEPAAPRARAAAAEESASKPAAASRTTAPARRPATQTRPAAQARAAASKPARAAATRPTAVARPARRAAGPAATRRKTTTKAAATPARRPAAKTPARKAAPTRAQKRR